jgi:hypothetical protein
VTRRPALGLAALAVACSTAAVESQRRGCDDDSDCRTGEQCSDYFCYASELPPRDALALDVRSEFSSPQFRIELLGDDVAVARVLDRTPNRFYVSLLNKGDELPGVRDRLVLSLIERRMLLSPNELMKMEKEYVEIPGELRLVQPSRLGRGSLIAAGLRYPVVDPVTGEEAIEPEVIQTWPRYDPSDARADLPLLAEVTASDDVPVDEDPLPSKLYGRGIVYRQLVRKNLEGASTQVFAIPDLRECHRKLSSELRFPDGAPAPLDPPVKVSVSMRHAGRPAPDPDDPQPHCDPTPSGGTPATCSTATLLPQSSSECTSDIQCAAPYRCYKLPNSATKRCGCQADAECPGGQVCNLERQQCALPLTDLPAIRPLDVDLLDFASVQSWVYTYCEDAPTLPQRTMEFIVTAASDSSLGLPRLNYRVVSDFFYDDGELPTTTMPAICLPTWLPAQTIDLTIGGPPAEIYKDSRDRSWVCCETACIDPTDDNPTVVDGTCSIKAAIGATGNFKIRNPDTWIDAGCMPLYGADAEGFVRSTYNAGNCPEGAGCAVDLSPGAAGGDGQTYELQIEPPVGSIFRSAKVPLTVQEGTVQHPIELGYRVLLRGKVIGGETCESGGDDCGSDNAEVLAERVTRDEDKSTLLGPYFYTARTLPDTGEYVLPVNPGVYLLTALPEISVSGSATGPAPLVLVDLRETSPLVREENGILVADAPELTLQPGVSYTIELDEFAASTRVIPLDVTTWVDLTMDGAPLDLGAPETCAPSEACLIRRLRPGNSPLLLTQDQFITYVARAAPGAPPE